MSQSNNAHVVRKRGSNVIYPYSDELAEKPGFVTLTMQEALDQGLLDRKRHKKTSDPHTAEMLKTLEALRDENAALRSRLNGYAEVELGSKPAPEPTPEPTPEPAPEATPSGEQVTPFREEEATELSQLLSEISAGDRFEAVG